MNLEADKRAKAYLWESLEQGLTLQCTPDINTTMPTVSITTFNKTQYISSRTARTLTQLLAQKRSLNYWKTRRQIFHPDVDMAVLKHAASTVDSWEKKWLSKWQSGICGVGIHLKRWKDQEHSKCPRCQTEGETVNHVIHCQHHNATHLWHTGVEDIEEWMRKNDCIPGLEKAVGQRLREWRNNKPLQLIRHQDERILNIIQAMDNIGWKHLGFGLIPQQWTQHQNHHLKNSNSKLSGVHWMSKFITSQENVVRSKFLCSQRRQVHT